MNLNLSITRHLLKVWLKLAYSFGGQLVRQDFASELKNSLDLQNYTHKFSIELISSNN